MSNHLDLETRLSRFLVEEAPARAPERLIEASRDRIARTSQSRRARIVGTRVTSVMVAPVGVVAAVLAIALVGTVLLLSNRSGPAVGSTPASALPSAPASPSPSAYPCETGPGTCLGPLNPGTYDSQSFVPTVRYTVPDGWINSAEARGQLDLRYAAGGQYTYPDGLVFHDGISIFRRPVAESATSRAPQAGIGPTANDLAQWLVVGHPDLSASAPTPVSVGAGSGYRLTLSVPAGARPSTDHCATDHGEPRCASLFISSDPAATYGFGLVGPETAVIYLLDLPSGDTVMVVIDDVDGVDQPGLEAAAMPVVNSLAFSP